MTIQPFRLPVQTATLGLPYSFNGLWTEAGVPVDMTGWTGTLKFASGLGVTAWLEADLTLGADGTIYGPFTATETLTLTPHRKLFGGPVGICQISLDAPTPALSQRWFGTLNIAGVI
jgi:hypothetical protein